MAEGQVHVRSERLACGILVDLDATLGAGGALPPQGVLMPLPVPPALAVPNGWRRLHRADLRPSAGLVC